METDEGIGCLVVGVFTAFVMFWCVLLGWGLYEIIQWIGRH